MGGECKYDTERMDEIAEKGYAAHWKYKGCGHEKESSLEEWIAVKSVKCWKTLKQMHWILLMILN